jgi:two-component system, chemotaxis family, sensor kinase CheA
MTLHLDTLRTTYFDECAELLDSVYAQLAALSEQRADGETIHALFRAIHSIKGGGGVFGFARIGALAHVMETLLDLMRDGSVTSDPLRVGLVLRGTDILADLMAAERTGGTVPAGIEESLLAELEEACEGQEGTVAVPTAQAVPAPGAGSWRIDFAPHAALFRNANEPLLLVRELKRLGPVTVACDQSHLPAISALNPEDAYLRWTFQLDAAATRAQIDEIFEFVADDCDLAIHPLTAEADAPAVEAAAVAPGIPPPARSAGAEPVSQAAQSVRVDVAKVDKLVNLVGELVINQSMLVQMGATLPPDICPGLIAGLETLSQHLRELQEGVMAIRTQPVKSVFARMPRLVRELSAQLGKEVRLVVTGEGTEIDKTVVEQLADPLTHLLRNALDHGVETPAEREAAGKPRQGTVLLSAEQRSGRIIIELSDDGRGLNRPRILARARERGLLAADAVLSDSEIDELIFLPGFSTATAVSSVSGRGVGMDVVRRNIQSLGGRIAIESVSGAGSRFILSLPLTLAVMDGLVVSVGEETYVVPLSAIVESLRPRREDIHPVVGGGDILSIRGAYIPLLALHRRFNVPGAQADPSQGIVVIVDTDSAGRIGLVVDELIGQQQIVVKSLEANYGRVPGIGGATILGDGHVALILDIAVLKNGNDRHAPRAAVADTAHLQ